MTAEPPEAPERGRTGRRLRRLGGHVEAWQLSLIMGVVAAVAVGGYLWLSSDATPTPRSSADAPPPPAEQGIACPHLQEAFAHHQAGNRQALRRSVNAAARASEQALQQSGQEFGQPEKIAIEFQYVLTEQAGTSKDDAADFLTEARKACQRVGEWPG
jgi:hypothetical protein